MSAALIAIPLINAILLACLVPLARVYKSIPRMALTSWLLVCSLIQAVNAGLWRGNVGIRGFIWCDIATRILVVSNMGISGSLLALAIKLEYYASNRPVRNNLTARRLRTALDLALCYGIPIIFIPLYTIVQDHRFSLVPDYGCFASIHPSTPGILLIWFPTCLLLLLSFAFTGTTISRVFNRSSAQFEVHVGDRVPHSDSTFVPSSSSSPPSSSYSGSLTSFHDAASDIGSAYLRTLSVVAINTTTISVTVIFYIFSVPYFRPWTGWASVHREAGTVNVLEAFEEAKSAQIMWWIAQVAAMVYAVCAFGVGEEGRDVFRFLKYGKKKRGGAGGRGSGKTAGTWFSSTRLTILTRGSKATTTVTTSGVPANSLDSKTSTLSKIKTTTDSPAAAVVATGAGSVSSLNLSNDTPNTIDDGTPKSGWDEDTLKASAGRKGNANFGLGRLFFPRPSIENRGPDEEEEGELELALRRTRSPADSTRTFVSATASHSQRTAKVKTSFSSHGHSHSGASINVRRSGSTSSGTTMRSSRTAHTYAARSSRTYSDAGDGGEKDKDAVFMASTLAYLGSPQAAKALASRRPVSFASAFPSMSSPFSTPPSPEYVAATYSLISASGIDGSFVEQFSPVSSSPFGTSFPTTPISALGPPSFSVGATAQKSAKPKPIPLLTIQTNLHSSSPSPSSPSSLPIIVTRANEGSSPNKHLKSPLLTTFSSLPSPPPPVPTLPAVPFPTIRRTPEPVAIKLNGARNTVATVLSVTRAANGADLLRPAASLPYHLTGTASPHTSGLSAALVPPSMMDDANSAITAYSDAGSVLGSVLDAPWPVPPSTSTSTSPAPPPPPPPSPLRNSHWAGQNRPGQQLRLRAGTVTSLKSGFGTGATPTVRVLEDRFSNMADPFRSS